MVCGINFLYQNVSNSTNCDLDPATFDLLPRKFFQNKKGPLNFAAHGKLDFRPEIIQSLVTLAMEVKKAVQFRMGFGIEPLYLGQKIFWKKTIFCS